MPEQRYTLIYEPLCEEWQLIECGGILVHGVAEDTVLACFYDGDKEGSPLGQLVCSMLNGVVVAPSNTVVDGGKESVIVWNVTTPAGTVVQLDTGFMVTTDTPALPQGPMLTTVDREAPHA